MNKLLMIVGMSVGGWVGWELGALVSTFVAFVVSVIGTAIGLYAVNRFSKHYLP
ncbi:MAG: hypothetical protein GWM92_15950 [Gemmatimonadetes bacterium]|nr:hypothetical protein [Gemmatimonadota bacterium]NIU32784.1 hypothetical protein [Gemmatimonadota bacterium]NIU37215.1 hypothetical protein [Gemmatimonadota bacterium]NIV63152.1 hypothetical protein [Gemmatimonadota bacterium]NIV84158.1 hypothetical protein [Gemmatimonadota bacterium]